MTNKKEQKALRRKAEREQKLLRIKRRKRNGLFLMVGGLIFLIAISYHLFLRNWITQFVNGPSTLDEFAKCLTEKEAVMYGRDTCPACQKQKEKFGSAFKYINYIKCDFEPEKCRSKGIKTIPKWYLNNEEVDGNFKSLSELAEISKCPMPDLENSDK